MFNLLFITNKPDVAAFAEQSGVTRIFLDLERIGKEERQGHLDTVISQHSVTDIKPIKALLRKSELMVRINPVHQNSRTEVESVIQEGADIIMLPMFKTVDEVKSIGKMISGRVKLIPLVETYDAALLIKEVDELDCVDEIHIGLNDLHLDMKLKFMFELFSNGFVDSMTRELKKPFGIGGVARLGEGLIPAELVLAEHVRLGSSGVILSRAFHQRSQTLEELKTKIDLPVEIEKLKEYLGILKNSSEEKLMNMHEELTIRVNKFVEGINEEAF